LRNKLLICLVALFAASCVSLEIYPSAHGGINCDPKPDGSIDSRCPKPGAPPEQKQEDELPSPPNCLDAPHSASPDQRCVESLKT